MSKGGLMMFRSPYLWNVLFGNVKKSLTSLQLLKRDTDFSYNKETNTYNFKGNIISADEAINFVEENSLKELKNKLMEVEQIGRNN